MIVIGQSVVKKLFPSESPLGKMIRVNIHSYVVVGTFVGKGSSFDCQTRKFVTCEFFL